MPRRPQKPSHGFTLIELILVMTIMTLIGVFAAMMISNIQDRVKRDRTEATINLIETALAAYKQDIGHYPLGDGSTLSNVLTDPDYGWARAGSHWFPEREDLKDAWGMQIQYCSHLEYNAGSEQQQARGVERTEKKGDFYNPNSYQIYSTGPNMKTWPEEQGAAQSRLCGTEEDDIRNWEHEEFLTPEDYTQ
jgi:prepilin-type N-terminal cleavage/methylation domain-containing protein